ncbi:hypothetical protein BGZ76_006905 [Entomortierella beljakovae]|nr:hypothetical protein BGZ76_006905 [Entomortierella beljakovae]
MAGLAGLYMTARCLVPRGKILSRTGAEAIFRDETILSTNIYRIQRINWRQGKRSYSTGTPPSNTTTMVASAAAAETVATTGAKTEAKLSKFRQYAEQFKNKPASHLISFGILHEITAIVPLPIVYFGLVETGIIAREVGALCLDDAVDGNKDCITNNELLASI